MENKEWVKSKTSNTIQSYKQFIADYPKSQFYNLAINAIDSINFKHTDSTNTLQAFQQFVDSFPNSKYIEVAKKKVAQEWWSIQVINSTLVNSEKIGNSITVSPSRGNQIAKIEIEVTALKGEIGRLRERLIPHESFINSSIVIDYLSGTMPESVKNSFPLWWDLHQPADVSKVNVQLFISKNVKLIIDTTAIIPQFAQLDGYGTTMTDDGQFSWLMKGYDPQNDFVVFFLRSKMLAAWFQQGKKIMLTLYYSVPKDIINAKLQFYNPNYYEINFKENN
jgi:hypothetical protein